MSKPRILVLDIETSPVINARFQFDRNPYISADAVLEDWYIICAAWKFVGSPKVYAVAADMVKRDDKQVVKALRAAIEESDIVVGHNLQKFDLKCLTTRLIVNRLQPLPEVGVVDTYRSVKKVGAFTSSKLTYLSRVLNGQDKLKMDFQDWLDCRMNKKSAIKKMVDYNKIDVVRAEELYISLLPYIKSHPHVGVLKGHLRDESCPKCGSKDIKHNGMRVSAAGVKKREIQCAHCHSYSRINYK